MSATWTMPAHLAFRPAVAEFERAYLRASLQRWHGNVTAVARASGVQRAGLSRKLARLGLRAADFRRLSA